ncbi:MAG: phosphoglycerate kinase [Candidatus Enteromonas sp.]|nr:phosphoglycerate kinase [Candidatus Enteromonas sp.]MDY6093615.1 phosphoglycerate kinase [Candidatus Enteromonas sp.]
MLTVEDLKDLKGKRVLVRVDFNVPQTAGVIRDDNRIQKALPTIQYLTSHGARVILMSHLGKIKWKETDPVKLEAMKTANDLACVAKRLGELVAPTVVSFSPVTRGAELKAKVDALKDGEILLVQNTRYEKGEEKNDPELSKEWASLADVFVMDAFGSAHRAHASTVGVPAILKAEGKPVAEGYLMLNEVKNLSRCVDVAEEDRPYVAILGGFKVSDKIKVIDSLLKKCDYVLIGGAMAYTFEKAIGLETGNSPVETEQLEYARKCIAESKGRLLLPIDAVVTDNFDENAPRTIKVVDTVVELGEGIPAGFEGVDIGPKTRAKYQEVISQAKMVFWNGPMGVFEQKDFQAGTIAVCEAIKDLEGHAFSVIGGGDSASAAKQLGYKSNFSHVSTGGGASLEMIETDGHLPGVDVLR